MASTETSRAEEMHALLEYAGAHQVSHPLAADFQLCRHFGNSQVLLWQLLCH